MKYLNVFIDIEVCLHDSSYGRRLAVNRHQLNNIPFSMHQHTIHNHLWACGKGLLHCNEVTSRMVVYTLSSLSSNNQFVYVLQ